MTIREFCEAVEAAGIRFVLDLDGRVRAVMPEVPGKWGELDGACCPMEALAWQRTGRHSDYWWDAGNLLQLDNSDQHEIVYAADDCGTRSAPLLRQRMLSWCQPSSLSATETTP